MVVTEPNVADPALLVPVALIKEDNTVVPYADETELRKAADQIHDALLRQRVQQETITAVLRTLGVTWDEYLLKAQGRV